MMPGETQPKIVAIAADATAGNCQNCSVLQQSLAEYVSSFLALKQKITVSDDRIRLQQHLEELQIRLVTLEKKTDDYECIQAELDEKRQALKGYENLFEEKERVKRENSRIVAENKELEDQLKNVKDMMEAQKLENSQLRREKVVVENDLLHTQASLKTFQTQAEKVDKLMEENSKLTSIKESSEKKVTHLEDSVSQQNHQISLLTKEKNLLERNINDLQVRLMTLERERNKEYKSTATQATVPAEPKVDKEKIRMLLEKLWVCVEPEQKEATNQLQFIGSSHKQVLLSSPPKQKSPQSKMSSFTSHRIRESTSSHMPAKADHRASKSSEAQNSTSKVSLQCLNRKKLTKTPEKVKESVKEDKANKLLADLGDPELSFEKILAFFKPLPPCLSPLGDLGLEVESMDIDDNKEKETHPKPSGESLPPEQKGSLQATSLTSGQKDPEVSPYSAKENIDLEVVPAKDAGHMANETDSENLDQNVLAPQMKDGTKADIGNVHHQNFAETKREPASVLSVSAPPHSPPPSVEPVSKAADRVNPSSVAETGNSSGEAKQDPSDDFEKMDENTSTSNGTLAEPSTPDDSDSQRGTDAPVISGEATVPLVTSTTLPNKVKDTKVPDTEGVSVEERSQNASACTGQEKTTSPCKDTEMSEDAPKERTETDALAQTGGSAAQEPGEGGVTVSPGESNDGSESVPPLKSTQSKEDKEHGQANIATPSTEEVNKETMDIETIADKGLSLSDCQETQSVISESLKEDTQSACKQSSLKCPSPPVKPQTSEIHSDPEKLNADVDLEYISKNKKAPVPNSEEESTSERAIVKDFPQERIDAGSSASLIHNAAPTQGQIQSLEACEKQTSHSIEGNTPSTETTIQSMASIVHIRSEVGLPLPPVLTPVNTPPKAGKSINPRHAIGKLLFPSPMDTLSSPTTPVKAHLTPNGQQLSSSSLNSPIPPNGVPSSPLQFGSATPKHAVPVPGRLPTAAMNSSPSSSTSPSQENSMRILDSMYPQLSARARTLSILRGNVGLGVCPSESGTIPAAGDGQVSSFKTVNSTSTAFTKAEARGVKRPAVNSPQPVRKSLRLGGSSADVGRQPAPSSSSNSGEETASPGNLELPKDETNSKLEENRQLTGKDLIVNCLNKTVNDCFDLLPVIRSHLHVGRLPEKPVLRDEEKEVISQICRSESHIADEMLVAIRNKLKAEKQKLSSNCMQALCRVYTGICRQKRDQEKVHLLAYNILTEDFPHCSQLVLFMVTTWRTVLSHSSSLCQAIHTVTKLKAHGDLGCLSAFLDWDNSPPCDIDHLMSRTIAELKSGSNLAFAEHGRYGVDLSEEAWEHIFTLHLLCSHKKWKWTYENLLGKELWPLMNTWVTQPRDQQEPISDVTVAMVLRLIGRLCQLGLGEGCVTNVGTVANVINTFGRHGENEGVPWAVQLAAIYCMHELSPCNPKPALDALAGWRGETSQSVPPAVTSCITQLASICRHIMN